MMMNNLLAGLSVIAVALSVITFFNMVEIDKSFDRIEQKLAQTEVYAQQLNEGL